MRFNFSRLAVLFLASTAVAAPFEVEEREPDNDLDKRLTITESINIINTGLTGIATVVGVAAYLASLIKSLSDNNSCAAITGNVSGVNYQYQTTTTGPNCDTTAQLKTILAALDRAINYMSANNARQACFLLTHGGTWHGFLQVASEGTSIISNKCIGLTYTITV